MKSGQIQKALLPSLLQTFGGDCTACRAAQGKRVDTLVISPVDRRMYYGDPGRKDPGVADEDRRPSLSQKLNQQAWLNWQAVITTMSQSCNSSLGKSSDSGNCCHHYAGWMEEALEERTDIRGKARGACGWLTGLLRA